MALIASAPGARDGSRHARRPGQIPALGLSLVVIPWIISASRTRGGFVVDLRDWELPMFCETFATKAGASIGCGTRAVGHLAHIEIGQRWSRRATT